MIWIYHILFIHSSADELLCCFYLGAIMYNVAMNIYVLAFVWTYVSVSFGYIPGSGAAGLIPGF